MHFPVNASKFHLAAAACFVLAAQGVAAPPAADHKSASTLRTYCVQCHGKTAAAGLNLELLLERPVGDHFQQWEKAAAALEQKRMPPAKMPQPADAERNGAAAWIRARLDEFARKNAGDPGRVTMRRLTSAEYLYTIRDLTGADLKLEGAFASDAVGGEGFANYGDVQFMDDAGLERYLQAAKTVANHAVVGAGPLQFYSDPGQTGMELSAIHRIHGIYRTYGFRSASGEGGKPYGLDRYGKAFYACWRHENRAVLGEKATLEQIAAREGVGAKFIRHIWTVLHDPSAAYPTSEVIARYRKLPKDEASARAGSVEIERFMINWPRMLFGAGAAAEGGQGDERALVLTDESIAAAEKHEFRYFARRPRGQKTARVYLSSSNMNPVSKDKAAILWRNPMVRFRKMDRSAAPEQPLIAVLDEESKRRLGAGDSLDFRMTGDASLYFDIVFPQDAGFVEVKLTASIEQTGAGDAVMRCTLSEDETLSKGRPVSVLLGNGTSAGYKEWKKGVLQFAEWMPLTSHGEPTPSDRDPIPMPYNTAYNQPERDSYHVKVKYYRDDRFFVEKMVDDATRAKLDQAWSDLLASFDYHDAIFQFVGQKFKVDVKDMTVAALKPEEIAAMPPEPRKYVEALRSSHDAVQKQQLAAHPGHVDDCLRFAEKAWRRPLTAAEKDKLRSFYSRQRESEKLDHPKAIRALLTRILVSPAFLYRVEEGAVTSRERLLGNGELANRLSFFLWSSAPDEELRRADLSIPAQLEKQVKRMLADSRARRFAAEFFGQWLGFYRFDQYNGVDAGRFPEFTPELKQAMYDEAISFFEHIVRKDRPVREMFSADYAFLNKTLAKHYGVKNEVRSAGSVERVDGANAFQRGGMFRLGAVLTATSAPLRTSPVKRGDWMLRRVLGTPTPPPPADAGSIPADEKSFGGLSIQEKLLAHQRNAACAGCHTRIDPLGFPFERYDAVGRWRDAYSDGKPVIDKATTADKFEVAGVDGLLEYVKSQEPLVLRNFSRKLLGYALGRTVLGSDTPLLDRMARAGGETAFSKLVMDVVTSKQFRYRRDAAEPAQTAKR